MRPFNMFARRSEPSAEALAGAGPTKTYPAPPSATATPEAIASVAGGTAEPKTNLGTRGSTQFASSAPKTPSFGAGDVSSGFATPASVNMSAAQANGFSGAPQTASYSNTGAPNATTSGYQFGKKSFTPKATESVATTPASMSPSSISTPSTSLPAGQQAPSSYAAASAFTPPSMAASSSANAQPSAAQPSAAASASTGTDLGTSGFTLPSDFTGSSAKPATTATDAISTWAPPATAAPTTPAATSTATANAASEPSTTSVAETKTAAAISSTSDAPASSQLPSGGSGYMPGSTGGSSAYPASKYPTSTSGSFYR
ncbi:hypothetical protein [Novipirellula sp.]|uniref:hypothetical protein n=1 Tax=Novipirellula sp. TaxID=2795430 RepID=UPI003568D95C